MLAQKIAELKKKLQEEKNFSATMHAFFDLQDNYPDFVGQSKPTKVKMLEKVISDGAGSAIGKQVRIGQFMPMKHKESGLIHGFYVAKAGAGSFFFFDDIRMGMGLLQDGTMSHTFRISADVWNQRGESVKGNVSDLDVGDDSGSGAI